MEEEKKYQIVGEVRIGSDEYRDLIEDLAKAKSDYCRANSERWEEQQRARKAEEEVKSWKEKASSLLEFVNGSEDIKMRYEKFLTEKALKELLE